MKNLSRFESVQSPSVTGFLIVLEIAIAPLIFHKSDTIQVNLHSKKNSLEMYKIGVTIADFYIGLIR